MLSLLGVGVCCRLCGLFGIGAVFGILAGLFLSVMAYWRLCLRITGLSLLGVGVYLVTSQYAMAVVIQTCVSPFSL